LGSRIVELHNGSSLSTGNAGQGESNARRYLFEHDLVEAIIELPSEVFYNTPSTTYIWILANKKEERRKGKVQLINANSFFKPLRQSMGDRSREIPADLRKRIIDLYLHYEENEKCKILSNDEFGFSLISIRRPITENGHVITDKRGNPKVDKARSFTERVPYTYEGGIERFFNDEVLPYGEQAKNHIGRHTASRTGIDYI